MEILFEPKNLALHYVKVNPFLPDHRRREKINLINLIFIFTLLCSTSKGFMKAFKVGLQVFWDTTKKCENNKYNLILALHIWTWCISQGVDKANHNSCPMFYIFVFIYTPLSPTRKFSESIYTKKLSKLCKALKISMKKNLAQL